MGQWAASPATTLWGSACVWAHSGAHSWPESVRFCGCASEVCSSTSDSGCLCVHLCSLDGAWCAVSPCLGVCVCVSL